MNIASLALKHDVPLVQREGNFVVFFQCLILLFSFSGHLPTTNYVSRTTKVMIQVSSRIALLKVFYFQKISLVLFSQKLAALLIYNFQDDHIAIGNDEFEHGFFFFEMESFHKM